MERYQAFCPITAEPFRDSQTYTEILPCDALRPYVRCFWGTREPVGILPSEGRISKLGVCAQNLETGKAGTAAPSPEAGKAGTGAPSPEAGNTGAVAGAPSPETGNTGAVAGAPSPETGNAGMAGCGVPPVSGLVTPDVCMDIIFTVDYASHKIGNMFCGINDTYFQAQAASTEKFSVFAVRFYAWAAAAFAQESLQGTKNQFFDVGVHFEKLKKELEPLLLELDSLQERIPAAERILLGLLRPSRIDSLLLRAVDQMIECRGNLKILELATDLHISSRQMERIFHKNIGCNPKKMAELIRYQYVWQEACLTPTFCILDAVHKFGYTDQSHLLRNFQQIHGMTLTQAKNHAAKLPASL